MEFWHFKKYQAGQIDPAALICYEESDSAEHLDGYYAHNLIDKAQRDQYWAFKVGRSMFDVHPSRTSKI
jgi:hypothetical protein